MHCKEIFLKPAKTAQFAQQNFIQATTRIEEEYARVWRQLGECSWEFEHDQPNLTGALPETVIDNHYFVGIYESDTANASSHGEERERQASSYSSQLRFNGS